MPNKCVDLQLLRKKMVCRNTGKLWVYGYGSLIWKPGFTYQKRVIGKLNGYMRRFFQGTTTHRGTPDWPGRVATILSDPDEDVWGVAYQVEGLDAIDQALKHLAEREMITGGYHFERVLFHPWNSDPFYIQVYIADAVNKQYLGDASILLQAYQILHAEGVCGPNIEYVRKVVDFMSQEVPNGLKMDHYLYELNQCLHELENGHISLDKNQLEIMPIRVAEVHGDEEYARFKRRESEDGNSCACGLKHDDSISLNGSQSVCLTDHEQQHNNMQLLSGSNDNDNGVNVVVVVNNNDDDVDEEEEEEDDEDNDNAFYEAFVDCKHFSPHLSIGKMASTIS